MQDRARPGFRVGGGVGPPESHTYSRDPGVGPPESPTLQIQAPPVLPRLKVDEKVRECNPTPHPHPFYHHMTQARSRKNQTVDTAQNAETGFPWRAVQREIQNPSQEQSLRESLWWTGPLAKCNVSPEERETLATEGNQLRTPAQLLTGWTQPTG